MRLAAHQPQYLPWLGFFDKMDRVDRFILLDTVQYKKNEWQNRNRIRTAEGWQWLTVPVHYRYPMTIGEVRIDETSAWRRKHRAALRTHYGRAAHGSALLGFLESLLQRPAAGLADLNVRSIKLLAGMLGVRTPIVLASSLDDLPDGADARLIALCRRFGCDTYLAGAGGQDYMDLAAYRDAGIEVAFQAFQHPVYDQVYDGFEPNLSAIDFLASCGSSSFQLVRALREAAA
jgi:WbqC-like protein family